MNKTTKKSLAAKQGGGMDLAGLSDLASMLDTPDVEFGKPRMFDRARIHEDEHNARRADNPGFSEESIDELAQTMKEGRGVKSPLSLRSHPDIPGDFIINHGHRRFRASGVANLDDVPGFLDEDFDQYDQVIENIQREKLSAREIADFIGSELSLGKTQTDIAKLLGKSKAFVAQHVTLLNLPEPVADIFHSGQIKDITLVNELVRAHKENPFEVEKVLAEQEGGLAAKPLTREKVKALREPAPKQIPDDNRPVKSDSALVGMEVALKKHLDTAVSISQPGRDGERLTLQIHANNKDHLSELLRRMGIVLSIDSAV